MSLGLKQIAATTLDIATLRYPSFVYSGGFSSNMIPVFCLHSVEPQSIEEMLSFLDANRYKTLNSDEYITALTGKSHAPPKAVVLTFDDGWGSLWSVGFPILQRHGTKIVVFLAAGRIENRRRYWPNLSDLGAGRCSAGDVTRRDKSDQPLLAWEEIREMHESGLVDFQSHSLDHTLICKSSKIVDFVHPNLIENSNLLELPCHADGKPLKRRSDVRLGEPLFQTAPRLSDTPGLHVDRRVIEECVDHVADHGGEAFFDRPNWRSELLSVVGRTKTRNWPSETRDEQAAAIGYDLAESRRLIEEMLPGKAVKHICYPWHEAGKIAVELSREVGYEACYWGKTGGRYWTPLPGDPMKIARAGEDFLFRLPGKGRIRLLDIFAKKMQRRAKAGSPYLTH